MRDSEHHLFYCSTITGENTADAADTITLDECESNHAVSVLRIKAGQPIRITNGLGIVYDCQCASVNKRSVSCRIVDRRLIPKIVPDLTLLIGLPDKDRFETILEHAAALGVSHIVPIAAEHCRKPWWGDWAGLRRRFLSKMIVSMKQCLYPYVPQLDPPMPLADAVDKRGGPLIVADPRGQCLRDADILPHKKITCLVGPPGGLSDNEWTFLTTHPPITVITVKIADTRLRSELAATALCSRVIGAHLS